MHGEMKTSVLHGRFDAANVTQTHRRSFRSHERFHERARGSSCSPSTAHPLFPSLPSPSSIIPDMQRRTTRNEFFRPRSIDSINKGEDDFRVADRVMDSFVKASRKKKYVSSFVRS